MAMQISVEKKDEQAGSGMKKWLRFACDECDAAAMGKDCCNCMDPYELVCRDRPGVTAMQVADR